MKAKLGPPVTPALDPQLTQAMLANGMRARRFASARRAAFPSPAAALRRRAFQPPAVSGLPACLSGSLRASAFAAHHLPAGAPGRWLGPLPSFFFPALPPPPATPFAGGLPEFMPPPAGPGYPTPSFGPAAGRVPGPRASFRPSSAPGRGEGAGAALRQLALALPAAPELLGRMLESPAGARIAARLLKDERGRIVGLSQILRGTTTRLLSGSGSRHRAAAGRLGLITGALAPSADLTSLLTLPESSAPGTGAAMLYGMERAVARRGDRARVLGEQLGSGRPELAPFLARYLSARGAEPSPLWGAVASGLTHSPRFALRFLSGLGGSDPSQAVAARRLIATSKGRARTVAFALGRAMTSGANVPAPAAASLGALIGGRRDLAEAVLSGAIGQAHRGSMARTGTFLLTRTPLPALTRAAERSLAFRELLDEQILSLTRDPVALERWAKRNPEALAEALERLPSLAITLVGSAEGRRIVRTHPRVAAALARALPQVEGTALAREVADPAHSRTQMRLAHGAGALEDVAGGEVAHRVLGLVRRPTLAKDLHRAVDRGARESTGRTKEAPKAARSAKKPPTGRPAKARASIAPGIKGPAKATGITPKPRLLRPSPSQPMTPSPTRMLGTHHPANRPAASPKAVRRTSSFVPERLPRRPILGTGGPAAHPGIGGKHGLSPALGHPLAPAPPHPSASPALGHRKPGGMLPPTQSIGPAFLPSEIHPGRGGHGTGGGMLRSQPAHPVASAPHGADVHPSPGGVAAPSAQVAGALRQHLLQRNGPGAAIPQDHRGRMEQFFGRPMDDVRLHTGPAVNQATEHLKADAFTIGRDVFFAPGKLSLGTKEGQSLLAHELTHVVQQTGTGARFHGYGKAPQTLEAEAEHVERFFLAQAPSADAHAGLTVNRYQQLYSTSAGIPLTRDQEARLTSIGTRALGRAQELLTTSGALAVGDHELSRVEVEIDLDLQQLSDSQAIDLWARAIVRAVNRQVEGLTRPASIAALQAAPAKTKNSSAPKVDPASKPSLPPLKTATVQPKATYTLADVETLLSESNWHPKKGKFELKGHATVHLPESRTAYLPGNRSAAREAVEMANRRGEFTTIFRHPTQAKRALRDGLDSHAEYLRLLKPGENSGYLALRLKRNLPAFDATKGAGEAVAVERAWIAFTVRKSSEGTLELTSFSPWKDTPRGAVLPGALPSPAQIEASAKEAKPEAAKPQKPASGVDPKEVRAALYREGEKAIAAEAKVIRAAGKSADEVAHWTSEARKALDKTIREQADEIIKQAARHTESGASGEAAAAARATRWAGRLRIAGRIFIALDIGVATYHIATAAEVDRPHVMAQEAGRLGGAILGGMKGASVGARLGLLTGPWAEVGVPVGAVAGGIVGGAIGAFSGEKVATWAIDQFYPPADTRFESGATPVPTPTPTPMPKPTPSPAPTSTHSPTPPSAPTPVPTPSRLRATKAPVARSEAAGDLPDPSPEERQARLATERFPQELHRTGWRVALEATTGVLLLGTMPLVGAALLLHAGKGLYDLLDENVQSGFEGLDQAVQPSRKPGAKPAGGAKERAAEAAAKQSGKPHSPAAPAPGPKEPSRADLFLALLTALGLAFPTTHPSEAPPTAKSSPTSTVDPTGASNKAKKAPAKKASSKSPAGEKKAKKQTPPPARKKIVTKLPDGQEIEFEQVKDGKFVAYKQGTSFTGSASVEVFSDADFAGLGLTTEEAYALRFVSLHESAGHFDALNTYDQARVSFGMVQYAGGDGRGLRDLLWGLKQQQRATFDTCFGAHGIDVEKPAKQKNPTLTYTDPETNKKVSGNDAEKAIQKDPALWAVFVAAGRNRVVQEFQIREAKRAYVDTAAGRKVKVGDKDVALRQVLKSKGLMTMLVDRSIQEGPGIAAARVKTAVAKVAQAKGATTADALREDAIQRALFDQILADLLAEQQIAAQHGAALKQAGEALKALREQAKKAKKTQVTQQEIAATGLLTTLTQIDDGLKQSGSALREIFNPASVLTALSGEQVTVAQLDGVLKSGKIGGLAGKLDARNVGDFVRRIRAVHHEAQTPDSTAASSAPAAPKGG